MKKEKEEILNQIENDSLEHSLVCNDQLFYQELRIAAEEAEKGQDEDQEHRKK